ALQKTWDSPRYRPQVHQTHRLDPLGLDDVDPTNTIRLRPQFLLDVQQPPIPVTAVRLELPYLLLIEQLGLRVAVLLDSTGNTLPLVLQDGTHGLRLLLTTFRQLPR